MLSKDYYQVLNLAPSCTHQEVKKNYHKLALIWHPDKHINKSEAEGKFTEINEAYTILGDANKRKIYDTSGQEGLDNHEKKDFTSNSKKNFFCKKNFQGTNKSPFDILRDIFDDKDDDDFFKSFDPFDISDDFRCNIKSFIDDTLMSSENEDSDSFFQKYTPTFMDSTFFTSPPPFPSNGSPQDSNSQTEFFSFFSSLNTETQSFSRTSTTIRNQGKVRTSTKQRVQQNGKVFENKETVEFNEFAFESNPGRSLNCKRSSRFKSPDVVIIDDDDVGGCMKNPKANPQNKNKSKQQANQRECKRNKNNNKNSFKFFEFSDFTDEECDLFESGLKFAQGVCKKSKK